MTHISRFTYSLLTLTALGCGGSLPQQSTSDEDAPVHRTVVRLNGDGSPTVSTNVITRAQQQAEIAARRAALKGSSDGAIATRRDAISVDWSCAGSSMWMFDGYNLTGSEICFYGQGTATLSEYSRFTCAGEFCFFGNWDSATKSYFAGNEDGAFHGPPFDPIFAYCSEAFGPYWELDVAGQCARVSYELTLFN